MERNECVPSIEEFNAVGQETSTSTLTSPEHATVFSDDDKARKLGNIESFDSWEWDDYLLRQLRASPQEISKASIQYKSLMESHDIVNASRTRFLVISGTDVREETNEYDEEILTVLTDECLKSAAMLEKDKD